MKCKSIWELLAAGESVSEQNSGEKAEEPPVENSELLKLRKAYKRANIISTIGFGLAAVAIGSVLYLAAGSRAYVNRNENAQPPRVEFDAQHDAEIKSRLSELEKKLSNISTARPVTAEKPKDDLLNAKIKSLEQETSQLRSRVEQMEAYVPVMVRKGGEPWTDWDDENNTGSETYFISKSEHDAYIEIVGAHKPEIKVRGNHVVELSLTYSDPRLTEIPKQIGKFAYLTELDLSNNGITKISNLDNLKLLKSLNLDQNSITKIEGLDNLAELNYVSICDNKIQKVEGFNKLKKLQVVHLNNNDIDESEPSNQKEIDNLKKRNVTVGCEIYAPVPAWALPKEQKK